MLCLCDPVLRIIHHSCELASKPATRSGRGVWSAVPCVTRQHVDWASSLRFGLFSFTGIYTIRWSPLIMRVAAGMRGPEFCGPAGSHVTSLTGSSTSAPPLAALGSFHVRGAAAVLAYSRFWCPHQLPSNLLFSTHLSVTPKRHTAPIDSCTIASVQLQQCRTSRSCTMCKSQQWLTEAVWRSAWVIVPDLICTTTHLHPSPMTVHVTRPPLPAGQFMGCEMV